MDPRRVNLKENLVYLLERLFLDPSILKIGFAFDHEDIIMLSKVGNGALKKAVREMVAVLDISKELQQSIKIADRSKKVYSSSTNEGK